MNKSLELLAGLDVREFSCIYDVEAGEYDIRYGMIGVCGSNPVDAYSVLRGRLIHEVSNLSYDQYTLANGTVYFSVAKYLQPKLEGETHVVTDNL
jgi:hypothetical protein